jgi:hypothetical protein
MGASDDVMTDACEYRAVKEVGKLVEGARSREVRSHVVTVATATLA